jgi:protein BCP1
MEIVNVDFELFNYDAEIDFHGVKSLLRQLFDVDAKLLNMSGLSELVIQQNTIGSTCKVDDKANDAYAFLTVLNSHEHREKPPVTQLLNYLSEKATTNKALSPVSELLASEKPIGLVLAERLINMPTEIIPPMWSMLLDEIEAAVEDGEPYEFSHYLIVSRTYLEVESNLDQGERKKKKAKEESETFYFHPEDEELRKHAVASGSYPFTKDEETIADSKRAFQDMGIRSHGFMMLIEASKFASAVKSMAEYVGAPS